MTDAWTRWQHQVSRYLDEHRLLPTPTTGLEFPFDVANACWRTAGADAHELPSLCRFTDSMGSMANRAAVLLFLSYLKDYDPYEECPKDDESHKRELIRKLHSDATSLLPVDQIDATWLVRWELIFAADAGLWKRSRDLVQQWVALAPSQERDALTTLACMNLLSVHPLRAADMVADFWSAYEGSQYSKAGEMLASVFASRLDDRSTLDLAPWSLPRAMSADEFARVLDAETAIAKLMDAGSGDATHRLVGAWCNAVRAVRSGIPERTREAAQRYAVLAREADLRPWFEDGDKMRRMPAWSSAILFRAIGDLDSAREMATFWTNIDPESQEGWKFRAQIERDLGVDDFADSYERYIQLSPETDSSWERSELLRLLLESRELKTADRALRLLALEHADRPVVDEMLKWDWPAYSQLHETTRIMWWEGLVFVCDGRLRERLPREPWRHAAACFGEAAAQELRTRVFGPLQQAAWIDRRMLGDREDRIANAILNSKVTLGTMVTALEVACNADSALGKQLDRFLTQRHWPLRVHLRSKKALDRLRTATDSRNRAAHGSDITPEEARQVYLEARAILDVLAKNGSDIGRVK